MPLIVPLLVTVAVPTGVVRVSTTPAPFLPSITAPALLVKFVINPTLTPSVLPSITPLPDFKGSTELLSVVRTGNVGIGSPSTVVPVALLIPRPLVEVILPVFTIALLPSLRFSA